MAQYQNLEVWQKSHELVLDVYRITQTFPQEERFRLADQMCRSVSSVPMNICEGTGRNTDKDFNHFLYIARGSLYETKYQLLLSKDLGYISNNEYEELLNKCNSIGRLLNSLIRKIGGKRN